MMNPKLHTPVCDLLGCDVPIVLAGMGGVARSDLVIAVTQAGGFGFLGMVRESPELIRTEVESVRAATTRDFGVNLIPAATKSDLLEAELTTILELRVPVVAMFWDIQPGVVRRLREAGVLVVYQVGSAEEAKTAEAAGAQIIIVQGVEAGGHVRGLTPRDELIKAVVAHARVPVLAAGGLVNGRDLVNALSLGAEGMVLGTAFLASPESFAHDYHKQRIVEAKPNETLLTQAFHVNWPRGANVRVLPNSVTRGECGDPFTAEKRVIGHEAARSIWLFSTDSPQKNMTGDFEKMALYAGAGSGAIDAILPARERIRAIIAEAEQIVRGTAGPGTGTTALQEPDSPVCYAREADDIYAGYAPHEELVAFLNLLLEAERAGARIAARTALETGNDRLRQLLRAIHRDEAACCAMLLKWIQQLAGAVSPHTGDFYEKCLAISGVPERVAFINRGQGWVVRKLRELLPRIRDDALHADLSAMLQTHQVNIARAADELDNT
jgi:nitronate monooxygenase